MPSSGDVVKEEYVINCEVFKCTHGCVHCFTQYAPSVCVHRVPLAEKNEEEKELFLWREEKNDSFPSSKGKATLGAAFLHLVCVYALRSLESSAQQVELRKNEFSSKP